MPIMTGIYDLEAAGGPGRKTKRGIKYYLRACKNKNSWILVSLVLALKVFLSDSISPSKHTIELRVLTRITNSKINFATGLSSLIKTG